MFKGFKGNKQMGYNFIPPAPGADENAKIMNLSGDNVAK